MGVLSCAQDDPGRLQILMDAPGFEPLASHYSNKTITPECLVGWSEPLNSMQHFLNISAGTKQCQ